jgi:hypothetical protein
VVVGGTVVVGAAVVVGATVVDVVDADSAWSGSGAPPSVARSANSESPPHAATSAAVSSTATARTFVVFAQPPVIHAK